MTISHQEYANLSSDAYGNRKNNEEFEVDDVAYRVLKSTSNSLNGYQGTIYQRKDTGEIIVAHRGTEVPGVKGILQDAIFTDGSMALSRINPQADDAIELTQYAIRESEKIQQKTGVRPEVTVTGHSLGGCLAQITAHHFDLYGETFNAYGAASLGLRVPEGGQRVLNHVRAGDTVSAASGHYGQVRVYATETDVRAMTMAGYENTRDLADNRWVIGAVGLAAASHSMHNFTRVDGDGRPDRSALDEPINRALAQEFDPMIDKFRSDVALMRQGITFAARGPLGNALDSIRELRGPLDPGEPLVQRTSYLPPTPEATPKGPQAYDSPLFGPGALRDFGDYVIKPDHGPAVPYRSRDRDMLEEDAPERQTAQPKPLPLPMTDATHSAHHLYLQVQSAMRRPDFDSASLLSASQRDQLLGEHVPANLVAGALSYDRGFRSLDHVVPSTKINPETGMPHYLIVVQGDPENPAARRAPVDTQAALSMPLEQASQLAQTLLHAREQQQAQEMSAPMRDVPSGPMMTLGGRSLQMPTGDGGDSSGGGDGGGE